MCDVFRTVSFSMLCTFNMHTILREKPVSEYSLDTEAEILNFAPICTIECIYKATDKSTKRLDKYKG